MDWTDRVTEGPLAVMEGAILLLCVALALALDGTIDESFMTGSWMTDEPTPLSSLGRLVFAVVAGLVGYLVTGGVRLLRESTTLGLRDFRIADRRSMSDEEQSAHRKASWMLRVVDGAMGSIAMGASVLLISHFLDHSGHGYGPIGDLLGPLASIFLLIFLLANGILLECAERGWFGVDLAMTLLADRDDRLARRNWLLQYPRKGIEAKVDRLVKLRR